MIVRRRTTRPRDESRVSSSTRVDIGGGAGGLEDAGVMGVMGVVEGGLAERRGAGTGVLTPFITWPKNSPSDCMVDLFSAGFALAGAGPENEIVASVAGGGLGGSLDFCCGAPPPADGRPCFAEGAFSELRSC